MNLGLQDKVALVTGGAGGIGEAIVRAFAAEGAIPVILDRKADAGSALITELGTGLFFEIDLTDEAALRATVDQILSATGRIDIVVNNAGVNDKVGLDQAPAAFLTSLQRNLLPAFTLVSCCLDALKRTRGTVINITSKVAETGQGGTSGYAAAKGGLNGLTREWAVDLAPHGIRCNAVAPAEVMTPMYREWLDTQPDPEATLTQIESRIPLDQRFTTPDEIAATVVFLASPRSSHTTGQILHPDGGYMHLDRATPN